MGYDIYTKDQFKNLRVQHNIMALVGNGFVIQVMNDYQRPSDTRYEAFYHYLKFRDFDERNLIFAEMNKLRKIAEQDRVGSDTKDAKNWSDLEATIGKLLDTGEHSPDEVYTSLRQIQREFSVF